LPQEADSGTPTGRFAPSPTGPLHLGSLRTALAAWLWARSAGGRFRLRLEDLDPERSRASWEPVQMAALTSLGVDWDGPVLRQSERAGHYARALTQLEAAGRVYPCFCTRAESRAAAAAPDGGSAPPGELPAGAYAGTCRGLSDAERTRRIATGAPYALRFDARRERVDFTDGLAGRQSWVVDDCVLRRADGVFAYQLAVVVDDHDQGVNQVVRGADLLDSVGRQVLLARGLGYPEPAWVHVPLVLGPDGRRLAKRYGSSAGPEAPGETLAWLAAALGISTDRPPRRAADLLAGFDPAQIPAEPLQLG
jgi:glutamyl-tRNA synthetase